MAAAARMSAFQVIDDVIAACGMMIAVASSRPRLEGH
jgi:hypothetical protein